MVLLVLFSVLIRARFVRSIELELELRAIILENGAIVEVIDQKRVRVFHQGLSSKHLEKYESTTPKAECFYCFEVFGTPDEIRSTSF